MNLIILILPIAPMKITLSPIFNKTVLSFKVSVIETIKVTCFLLSFWRFNKRKRIVYFEIRIIWVEFLMCSRYIRIKSLSIIEYRNLTVTNNLIINSEKVLLTYRLWRLALNPFGEGRNQFKLAESLHSRSVNRSLGRIQMLLNAFSLVYVGIYKQFCLIRSWNDLKYL